MTDNISAALRESHEIQRTRYRKLLRAHASSERRSELFKELRIELAAYAAAEERFLYAPILMYNLNGSDAFTASGDLQHVSAALKTQDTAEIVIDQAVP